jgi:hypothetical protein
MWGLLKLINSIAYNGTFFIAVMNVIVDYKRGADNWMSIPNRLVMKKRKS